MRLYLASDALERRLDVVLIVTPDVLCSLPSHASDIHPKLGTSDITTLSHTFSALDPATAVKRVQAPQPGPATDNAD